MTAAEHTVLPEPDDRAQVIDLLQALRARGRETPQPTARLVSADGRQVAIPPAIYEVFASVVEALAQGLAVTIAPHHTVLTTQEAADFLGISRPTLIKLLDEGKLPYEQPNRHRRIRLADLLAFQDRHRARQRQILDELTAESVELGLYDTPADQAQA